MQELQTEYHKLLSKSSYSRSIQTVQEAIACLEQAKTAIRHDPPSGNPSLIRARQSVARCFEGAGENLKVANTGLKSYARVLDKTFPRSLVTDTEEDVLSAESYLINKAIAMHFLREGHFDVATCFVQESRGKDVLHHVPLTTRKASSHYTRSSTKGRLETDADTDRRPMGKGTSKGNGKGKDVKNSSSIVPVVPAQANPITLDVTNEDLHNHFVLMYEILNEIRVGHNLEPAIEWSRQHSHFLLSRGSNLEFELCKIKFIALFLGCSDSACSGDTEMDEIQRILNANAYARQVFGRFYQHNYDKDIRKLLGAMAFHENIHDSPFRHMFALDKLSWERIGSAFVKEFCSMLGLSAESPLLIATTAGAVAVPVLQKVRALMQSRKTEWTTASELPVEITLPTEYRFHSIFVCPVSKEQATDRNPPMMMPCGHVICKDSLDNLSKGHVSFKCPYCPSHSNPKSAKKVYF